MENLEKYLKEDGGKYLHIVGFNPLSLEHFIDAISKIDLPQDYLDKYNQTLKLINYCTRASIDEIRELTTKYKKIIVECVKDGNNLLRESFSQDLANGYSEFSQSSTKKIIPFNGENIVVYELEGQPFTMLIHNVVDYTSLQAMLNKDLGKMLIDEPQKWYELQKNNNISMSLVNEEQMILYGETNRDIRKSVKYGFFSVPSEMIKYTNSQDAGIDRDILKDFDYDKYLEIGFSNQCNNLICSCQDLLSITKNNNKDIQNIFNLTYNEVVIERENAQTKERLKPDYIMCIDEINEESIRAAKYFGVPIYVINIKKYPQMITNAVEKIEQEDIYKLMFEEIKSDKEYKDWVNEEEKRNTEYMLEQKRIEHEEAKKQYYEHKAEYDEEYYHLADDFGATFFDFNPEQNESESIGIHK